jgi:hypothetical protein
MGITRAISSLRTPPVDTMDLPTATVTRSWITRGCGRLYTEIIQRVVAAQLDRVSRDRPSRGPARQPRPAGEPSRRVSTKAWGESGALASWQHALNESISFTKDVARRPSSTTAHAARSASTCLYGTLRWQGSSGNRGLRAGAGSKPSRLLQGLHAQVGFQSPPEPPRRRKRRRSTRL